MPGRGRSHSGDDEPELPPPRAHPAAGSVRANEDAVYKLVQAGLADKPVASMPGQAGLPTSHLITRGTGRLGQQFRDWPIPGLKEVKTISPDGTIVQIDLP